MQQTNQVLALTTATRVDTTMLSRTSIAIQNNGPNAIYVRVGSPTGLAVGYGMKLNPLNVWSFPLKAGVPVYAICSVAQVAGAATDVTEL